MEASINKILDSQLPDIVGVFNGNKKFAYIGSLEEQLQGKELNERVFLEEIYKKMIIEDSTISTYDKESFKKLLREMFQEEIQETIKLIPVESPKTVSKIPPPRKPSSLQSLPPSSSSRILSPSNTGTIGGKKYRKTKKAKRKTNRRRRRNKSKRGTRL